MASHSGSRQSPIYVSNRSVLDSLVFAESYLVSTAPYCDIASLLEELGGECSLQECCRSELEEANSKISLREMLETPHACSDKMIKTWTENFGCFRYSNGTPTTMHARDSPRHPGPFLTSTSDSLGQENKRFMTTVISRVLGGICAHKWLQKYPRRS